MSSRSRWRSRSRSADLTLVSDRAVSQIGAGRSMLVNLVPEFLAVLAAPDPAAAYSEYLDRHEPVLTSYWENYVLDPASPHAEQVIAAAWWAGSAPGSCASRTPRHGRTRRLTRGGPRPISYRCGSRMRCRTLCGTRRPPARPSCAAWSPICAATTTTVTREAGPRCASCSG